MKTHELSKALNHLSRVLRAGPNIDLGDLVNLTTYAESPRLPKSQRDVNDRGAGLALLAEIANYNKRELVELIQYLGLPVEVKAADSVRDFLGRTLKYIQENPSAQDRLASSVTGKSSANDPSPLARALAILMNQQ